MIVFLHEDRAYHSWVTHHRAGFVLDGLRRPSKKRPTLHRAACSLVKLSTGKRTHWTTGRHYKACAQTIEELTQWAQGETGQQLVLCEVCSPAADLDPTRGDSGKKHPRFPPLARDILEFVLDTAVIHLDHPEEAYHVSAGDVARYLNKSVGQIANSIQRLEIAGVLQLVRPRKSRKSLAETALLFPTAAALQTLPIFEKESLQNLSKLATELQS